MPDRGKKNLMYHYIRYSHDDQTIAAPGFPPSVASMKLRRRLQRRPTMLDNVCAYVHVCTYAPKSHPCGTGFFCPLAKSTATAATTEQVQKRVVPPCRLMAPPRAAPTPPSLSAYRRRTVASLPHCGVLERKQKRRDAWAMRAQ